MQRFKTAGSLVMGALALWATLATIAPSQFAVTQVPSISWGAWLVIPLAVLWILFLLWSIDRRLANQQSGTAVAEDITPENVERRLREWSDGFGFQWQKPIKQSDASHFIACVSTATGRPINVELKKKFNRYLVLWSGFLLTQGQRTSLDSAPESERKKLTNQLALELSHSGIEFFGAELDHALELRKLIPITPHLTDKEFLAALLAIETANTIVSATVNLWFLDHGGIPKT